MPTPLRNPAAMYSSTYIYARVSAIIAVRDKVPRVIIYSSRHLEKKIEIKAPKHGFNAYLYSAKYRHYRVLRSKWSLELFHCHLLRDFLRISHLFRFFSLHLFATALSQIYICDFFNVIYLFFFFYAERIRN